MTEERAKVEGERLADAIIARMVRTHEACERCPKRMEVRAIVVAETLKAYRGERGGHGVG